MTGKIVKICHLDGRLPNLALMKISAYHKEQNDRIIPSRSIRPRLNEPVPDLVYGSSIFDYSRPARQAFMALYPHGILGGTGTGDMRFSVADAIGGYEPDWIDYSLYPEYNHSLGFTQRGCRLKCGFCVVPKKEGGIHGLSSVMRIWRGKGHPKELCLLDNDFFGSPDWENNVSDIVSGGFKVCLMQGINVRLLKMTPGAAKAMASMRCMNESFTRKLIYTAWDNLGQEKVFFEGLDLLLSAGIKANDILVYMLIGYAKGETIQDVKYRYERLRDSGVIPYPMVYDRTDKIKMRFRQWVLRRLDGICDFEDWGKMGYLSRPKVLDLIGQKAKQPELIPA